jgi:RNA polymerase sigma-70 factor (ECF subfamily)
VASSADRFHELVWPQLATVVRTARILTGGNDAEADDLAQETMLKAFGSIDQFHSGTDVRAWLMTILRNTRIDRLRARGASARDVSLDDIEVEFTAKPDSSDAALWTEPEAMLEAFSDQQVIDALQALPEEIRWTLLLVDVEHLDQKDAAEVLGVPVGTVKSRAHRGRTMLRESLSSHSNRG